MDAKQTVSPPAIADADSAAEAPSLETQVRRLESKLELRREDIRRVTSELKQLRSSTNAEIAELKLQSERLQAKLELRLEDNRQLKSQATRLESKLELRLDDNRQLKSELKQLQSQNMELQAEAVRSEKVARALFNRHEGGGLLPPPELRLHVGRLDTAGNFWKHGLDSSGRVLDVFGAEPDGPVLDWGCGTGRTYNWLRHFEGWRRSWYGCDVDVEAIDWLRAQGVERVEVCQDLPPTPYSDNSFAGLFCFSVMTHIHPIHHAAWYAEIHRVLRPGGRAYVTIHSDANILNSKSFTAAETDEYRASGSLWSERPGHYKHAAMVSEDFTRTAVGDGFEIVSFDRPGYQFMDALTLRKR